MFTSLPSFPSTSSNVINACHGGGGNPVVSSQLRVEVQKRCVQHLTTMLFHSCLVETVETCNPLPNWQRNTTPAKHIICRLSIVKLSTPLPQVQNNHKKSTKSTFLARWKTFRNNMSKLIFQTSTKRFRPHAIGACSQWARGEIPSPKLCLVYKSFFQVGPHQQHGVFFWIRLFLFTPENSQSGI